MPVTILMTYTTIYYLIPKYLLTKRYWTFLLYSIYLTIISAYFLLLSIFGGLIFLSHLKVEEMLPLSKSLILVFVGVFTIVFIASVFSLERQNQRTLTKNQELVNQLLERELLLKAQKLDYLKMQIHPHFLFNTLNTIYGFALQKSNYTAEMILKLSNLLDYLLYQSNASLVELKQEVQHIQDYISLEKVRFQDVLNVNFKLEGPWESILMPPMLFLPFVENAFKHGTTHQGTFEVDIHLLVQDNNIHFSMTNSSAMPMIQQQSGGIGLKNIRKRLDLLYADQYQLETNYKEAFFYVQLALQLQKSAA